MTHIARDPYITEYSIVSQETGYREGEWEPSIPDSSRYSREDTKSVMNALGRVFGSGSVSVLWCPLVPKLLVHL